MTINSKGILNMAAIQALDEKKYDFLMRVFLETQQHWTRNSKPVVDLFTGKIYYGMSLGYIQDRFQCDLAKYCIRSVKGSIEEGMSFGSYHLRACTVSIDADGDEIYGHKFMDCGSMDLQTLMNLYDSWHFKKQEMKKENIEIQKLKREKEELIKKVAQLEKILDTAREILKVK